MAPPFADPASANAVCLRLDVALTKKAVRVAMEPTGQTPPAAP